MVCKVVLLNFIIQAILHITTLLYHRLKVCARTNPDNLCIASLRCFMYQHPHSGIEPLDTCIVVRPVFLLYLLGVCLAVERILLNFVVRLLFPTVSRVSILGRVTDQDTDSKHVSPYGYQSST